MQSFIKTDSTVFKFSKKCLNSQTLNFVFMQNLKIFLKDPTFFISVFFTKLRGITSIAKHIVYRIYQCKFIAIIVYVYTNLICFYNWN